MLASATKSGGIYDVITVILFSIVHSAPLRDCSEQRPCYITAYKDAEGSRGQVLDWFCRDHSYDGHKGTDFGIGGFHEMDRGRPVFATATGQVITAADGFEDRCTSGRCEGGGGLGNHVIIEHAEGWQSRFGHLRNGSIRVEVGDDVDCSTQLGEVGSSGYSTGPHLHFEVRQNNRPVETFSGDCGAPVSIWRNQNGYRQLPSSECPVIGLDDSQVVDENLPDGSLVETGSAIEKRWVIRNVGTSTWDETVQAVLMSDSGWSAPAVVVLPGAVEPGENTTINIDLEVPLIAQEQLELRYQLQRNNVPFGAVFWLELQSAEPSVDAGIGSDAGTQDSGANGPIAPEPGESCGCSQTSISWMLWMLPLALRRRAIYPR